MNWRLEATYKFEREDGEVVLEERVYRKPDGEKAPLPYAQLESGDWMRGNGGAWYVLKPDALAYFLRGIAYAKKGKYDKAIRDFSEVISQKPYDADAYFARGTAHDKNGDKQQAEADFAKAKSLKAKN